MYMCAFALVYLYVCMSKCVYVCMDEYVFPKSFGLIRNVFCFSTVN